MPYLKLGLDLIFAAALGVFNQLLHGVQNIGVAFGKVLVMVVQNDGYHVGFLLEYLYALLKSQGRHAALDKNICGFAAAVYDLNPFAYAFGAAVLADIGQAVGVQNGGACLTAFAALLYQSLNIPGVFGLRVKPAVVGCSDNY